MGAGPWLEQELRRDELKEFKKLLFKAYDAGFKNTYTHGPTVDKAMRTKAVNKILAELS